MSASNAGPLADTTAMSSDQYAASHPPGIGHGYWHVARNRILWRKLRDSLRPGAKVLDIGCGPGIVVRYLRAHGVACYGSDLGTPEPEELGVAPYLFLGKDCFTLPVDFREPVEALLLMDVLEHLPEPHEFLKQCLRAFPNVRDIHVTVPARMELWSNYDEYFGHFRRYTRTSLAEMATLADVTVAESSYAFHGLYAAARVAQLITPERKTKLSAPRLLLAHAALGTLFDLEQRLLPTALKGSSIYARLTPRS